MPDDFLTIDQVAQRLALPPEMIRRRIESGDIPVHWVESDGKLEMRVAADDVGGAPPPPSSFDRAPGNVEAADEFRPVAGEPAAEEWADADAAEYPQGLWTPVEETPVAELSPWEPSSAEAVSLPEPEQPVVPVWRPDPETWEDEPLEATGAAEGAFSETTTSPYFGSSAFLAEPQAEVAPEVDEGDEEPEQGLEPAPLAEAPLFMPEPDPFPFSAPSAPAFGFEPSAPYEDLSEETTAYEEPVSPVMEPPTLPESPHTAEEVSPPSALITSETGGPGSLAINSIDARELVAGLFERWERALEQRIQAEQRLRFEAELEQRMRQVRDLRQELDQSRKTQAAQQAEQERELMDLRNKVRELEQAPRSRRLFRR
ncbi:MAG: OmpH family outer membrane protein [Candidatus Dormibacteria bacterium]